MFDDTQGYILASHRRDHVWHAFLRFRTQAAPKDLRDAVAGLSSDVTRTSDLVAVGKGQAPAVVMAVGLSWRGYERMKFENRFSPEFVDGFAARAGHVTGVDSSTWSDPAWASRSRPDALIVLASDSEDTLSKKETALEKRFSGLLDAPIRWEKGMVLRETQMEGAQKGGKGRAKEHFGFVDGVSQPFSLRSGGSSAQAPQQQFHLVLVPERFPSPGGKDEWGSYMAFVKIEQHVDKFREAARSVARRVLGKNQPTPDECIAAMEMIIGRRRDGNSVIPKVVGDNFKHTDDENGKNWAFCSHTRKMNPRKDPHARRILRRGVSYQNEDGEKGMLFQCFQSSLQDQFEFLMHNWANTASHPQAGAGRDPLIGAPSGPAQPWPAKYASASPLCISGLTTIHGGEYFYFPSIPSLRDFSKHPHV